MTVAGSAGTHVSPVPSVLRELGERRRNKRLITRYAARAVAARIQALPTRDIDIALEVDEAYVPWPSRLED